MYEFQWKGVRRYANTNVWHSDDAFSVKLHDTNIVCGYYQNAETTEVVLDSGGWKTVTTKKRMNEVAEELGLNYNVYQKKGQWFVDCLFPGNGTVTYTFKDGMTVPVYTKGR